MNKTTTSKTKAKKSNLFSFLKAYKGKLIAVMLLSLTLNGLSLLLPRISSRIINDLGLSLPEKLSDYQLNQSYLYLALIVVILILALIQNAIASQTSELVAAQLRHDLMQKLTHQSYSYLQKVGVSKLLTNFTSDVDAVKQMIAQGIVVVFSSVILLVGSAVMLFTINWKLAIPVVSAIPILFVTFGLIFSRINKYFTLSQEVVDSLNKVINESIVGAALIRLLNSHKVELNKYSEVNQHSKIIGLKIVNGFALLVPIINFVANLAVLVTVGYGGRQIINQTLNRGDYAAFFTYIGTFIGPIIFIGFLSTIFSRAFASFKRISSVLEAKPELDRGTIDKKITGEVTFDSVSLELGNKQVLKNISFTAKHGKRTAIIGPTAAGKTQIFYLIAGLLQPKSGKVLLDGAEVNNYKSESFYSQVGMVFQDSVIFNASIRENIAFSAPLSDDKIHDVLDTAALNEFVTSQSNNLDTLVAERGATLSGGQKQRLTLARALSVDPKLLLLDDFTARVDIKTEREIFEKLDSKYPDLTIISITQKIEPIKNFDQIILVMEGELIAAGKHDEILKNCFEYRQIYNSQQSVDK